MFDKANLMQTTIVGTRESTSLDQLFMKKISISDNNFVLTIMQSMSPILFRVKCQFEMKQNILVI